MFHRWNISHFFQLFFFIAWNFSEKMAATLGIEARIAPESPQAGGADASSGNGGGDTDEEERTRQMLDEIHSLRAEMKGHMNEMNSSIKNKKEAEAKRNCVIM